HRSQERGHQIMLDWLGLIPLLDFNLRLGEGTGAAIGISLAEASCRLLDEMATFAEAGVSEKDPAPEGVWLACLPRSSFLRLFLPSSGDPSPPRNWVGRWAGIR